jgi:hypothetical protein
MDMVIKIIGIVLVLSALGCLIKPDFLRGTMRFFSKGSRVYAVALMRFALAVVFFVAARECRNVWVILAFGILFLLSGMLVVVLGPKRIGPIIDWFLKQSALLLRFISLIAAALGVVIIIFA